MSEIKFGNGNGTFAEIMPIEPIRIIGEYEHTPFRFSVRVYRETLEAFSKRLNIPIEWVVTPDGKYPNITLTEPHLEIKIWSY